VEVLDRGHRYLLASLDGHTGPRLLQFVKREGAKYPGNVGHYEGTTSQEVLRALIDRAGYVNQQMPCWQTRLSIYLMGLVIWLYEHRAARRHHRKPPSFHDATFGATCKDCGHVGCVRAAPKPEGPQ
jgi:hypothetical protein